MSPFGTGKVRAPVQRRSGKLGALRISSLNPAGGMRKVLVLDANQRSALAVIRSLGRRGLTVVAADHRRHSLGAVSKYAAASLCYPEPATAPKAFVCEIIAAADRLGIDVIVPTTDLSTMLLVGQPDLTRSARLATPTAESYEALTDKARLVELARRLSVPVPETRMAHTVAEAQEASRDLGFPVVLKPARSRYLKGDRVLSTRVEIIRSPASLEEALRRQTWLEDIPCLVQRYIPGHGAGAFALYGPQGPIAWFAHRRIREKPPSGGVSVLSESAPMDPTMQSAASRILSAASWTGVAMIEFRVAVDGTPYLMEVNGRFWGSLQLAIDCGVDFPWLLCRLAQNPPLTEPQSYVLGRRLRWLLGDLDSLIIDVGRGRSRIGHKMRAIGAFMGSFADMHCRQEVLRAHDPRPGLLEVSQWFRALWK